MTHGNVAERRGTCQVCGRRYVWLHTSRDGRLVCVDEFACLGAWVLAGKP